MMRIQNLAVIFIIIILPISLIVSSYTGNMIKTLSLQASYDSKLNNSTYDALKAFQLNTFNSDTSDIANSKLRDIEASANTFFTSIANNFNMSGYNQDTLKEYVPALVYTMYDGFYIYSPFFNTLDSTKNNKVITEDGDEVLQSDAEILSATNNKATFKEGEKISGLQPYVFYSCRYKRGADDFVITYSLDNFITIKGLITIKGETKPEAVNISGYLLDNIETNEVDQVSYRGVEIKKADDLSKEVVCDESGNTGRYRYTKIRGTKYYILDEQKLAEGKGKWFSFLNGKKHIQSTIPTGDTSIEDGKKVAQNYYIKAYQFTNLVRDVYDLDNLTGANAVDENGNSLENLLGNYNIFKDESTDTSIEDPNSNFNQQRLAVIRYSIEKNLSKAINNYNHVSDGPEYDFKMPKLKENEWDKVVNNVSIISFLQGLSIGGKIYNGYSIITNNKNNEVVGEDSIYIIDKNNEYYRANDKNLIALSNSGMLKEGAYNIDLEAKAVELENGTTKYVIPKRNLS